MIMDVRLVEEFCPFVLHTEAWNSTKIACAPGAFRKKITIDIAIEVIFILFRR